MPAHHDTIIRTHKEFDKLFKKAEHKVSVPGLYVLSSPTDLDFSRLGMVISKKYLKKAVHRNLLKRIIRGYFYANLGRGSVSKKQVFLDCIVVATQDLAIQPKDRTTPFPSHRKYFSKIVAELFSELINSIDNPHKSGKKIRYKN